MKTVFSICLLFLAIHVQGQSSSETISETMLLDKKWLLNRDSNVVTFQQPSGIIKPSLSNISLSNIGQNMSFSTPAFANIKVPKFQRDFDYTRNTYSVIPLNDNMWITTARINSNYIGLGGLSSAGAQYNWRINDFVTYSGGVTFSKFNIYNNFDNNLNLNSNLRFELSDRFFFNAFGNLSTPASKNTALFRSLNYSMFPQNNFGGSFEFKVTDKWGVATGAEREFDPFKGKWVTRPFIMPVFYSK
jgi:hypothetical protein